MKTKMTLVAAAVVMSIGTTFAAQHEEPNGMFRQSMMQDDMTASNLIGMRVNVSGEDAAGDDATADSMNLEDVGEINDLIIKRDGTVDAVLVDIGGFLGMGERQVALGMSSIEFRDDQSTDEVGDFILVVPASVATLESAPEFDMSATDEMVAEADPIPQADSNMQTTEVAPLDGSASITGMTGDHVMDDYVPIPIDQVTSDNLTGAHVYTSAGDDIGEVSELLLEGDTVAKAIIDVGGFLGMGEKPVALDMADVEVLQFPDSGEIRVRVPMDKAQLESMPEYE